MKLEEACHSLKLECALRGLGFVDIGWRTVAHAGIYFVEPIGFTDDCGPMDESLGFIMGEHRYTENSGSLHFIFISAKEALDTALNI
tara:strand:- start:209 stop:469 length:261 start_codon:yes stop_codon:yes gene_type:complete